MTSASFAIQSVPGRAPLAASTPPRHAHTSVGGFCGVCGSVWPCKQANVESSTTGLIPVARW